MCFFFLLLIPAVFIVHIIAAIFSKGVRDQIKHHKALHVIWLVITLAVVACLVYAVVGA